MRTARRESRIRFIRYTPFAKCAGRARADGRPMAVPEVSCSPVTTCSQEPFGPRVRKWAAGALLPGQSWTKGQFRDRPLPVELAVNSSEPELHRDCPLRRWLSG